MYRILAAITLVALVCNGAIGQTGRSQLPKGLDALLQLTDAAERALAEDDAKEARQLLATVHAAPDFGRLDEDRRHFVLARAGELASAAADFSQAHALYSSATGLQRADSDDWMGRLNAAWFVGDFDDAVTSLAMLARHWPGELAFVSQWAVEALIDHSRDTELSTEFGLLEALFESGWQTDLGLEPTQLWLRLLERYVEEERVSDALTVASRLRDPMAIVSIRADQRFSALVASAPEWFSVTEASDAGIIEARLSVEDHPDLLAPAVALTELLLQAGRAQDALLVIDTHLARSAIKTVVGASFDDAVEESVRALTAKALALIALERWNEAAEQIELAASQTLPQNRSDDFFAVAMLQARLGQPDAALATLKKIPVQQQTPQAELVRFVAARARSDEAGAQAALTELLAAEDTAGAQAQRALLIAGQLDEAAELLIRRLNDPLQRGRALLEIQSMREQHWPDAALDWQTRAVQLLQRDDVRRSVAASGANVGDYALYRWN